MGVHVVPGLGGETFVHMRKIGGVCVQLSRFGMKVVFKLETVFGRPFTGTYTKLVFLYSNVAAASIVQADEYFPSLEQSLTASE